MKERTVEIKKNKDALNRREALKKIGKHSAYTAPALMTLLFSTKTKALSCTGSGCLPS